MSIDEPTRRDAVSLLAGGIAMTRLPAARATPIASAGSGDPFDALRRRWVGMLVGDGIDPTRPPYAGIIAAIAANARDWWTTMARPDGTARALWSDPLAGTAEYNTRVSMDRLRVMALAWATPGSDLAGDDRLQADLIAALSWLETHRYSILIERSGNWWEWEIGIPIALTDLLLLLHDPLIARDPALFGRLTAAIDRFTPAPYVGTAANRVWRSHVVLLNAIATRREDKLIAARRAFPTTFGDVTEGDGFHRDGSFVQHDDLAYTGGYGRDLLTRSALLIYLLDGSPWALAEGDWTTLKARVRQAFVPLIYRGSVMDSVRGRNLSRANLSDVKSGQIVIHALLYLAAVARDTSLTAIAKGWIAGQRTIYDIFAYDPKLPAYWLTPHMAQLASAAIADASIAPAADPVGSFAFPEMDRFIHRRPGFAYAIAMNSARIGNYETANEENLRGWYQGQGMTTLYRPDAPSYATDYWPTIDPYRLPGVTLDRRPRQPALPSAGVARNARRDVGMLSLGDIGLAAMRDETDAGGFKARRSWIAVSDRIVAIGTGISSDAAESTETIVENRMIADTAAGAVHIDGVTGPLDLGRRPTIRHARWLHIDGAGGYLFPAGQDVTLLDERRSGAWWDINRQGASPRDIRTRRYITCWIDHGARPVSAHYAYVFLPLADPGATRAAASANDTAILAQDETGHIVRIGHGGQEVVAAVMWQPGRAAMVTTSAPALLMWRRAGRTLELGLADPTQQDGGMIEVALETPLRRCIDHDPALTVTFENGRTMLRLACTDLRGRTVRATLAA